MQEPGKESRRNFIRKSIGAAVGFNVSSLNQFTLFPGEDGFNDTAKQARLLEPHEGGVIKAGFAEADITPALGMEMPGNYGKMFHEKLHDPCKVRAAVFDDGKKRVALVGIDSLMIPGKIVEEVRIEIESRCGIPAGAVMIGASHSHSSGPTGMIQPGEYDDASELVRSLAYEKSSCANAAYLDLVKKQLVSAVCQAAGSQVEVNAGIGRGIEDKVAFNRRFHMKNGLSYTHPGQLNKDIIGPAGPVDPEVGIIGAWTKEGKCIGCIINYACHATCNPGGISANWIYYLEQTVRGTMGQDCVVVFLQGACGDITQVDNRNPYVNRESEEWSRFVGGRVGAEAVKVLLSMPRSDLAPLDARSTVMKMKRRMPAPERVKEAYDLVNQPSAKESSTEWIFAKETVLLDAKLKREPVANVEVQVIQVGPAVFISNPAELFCEFGLTLKKKSPFPFTFPVELANDCVGYVPTMDAFGPHGGGYETRLTSYSNLEINAGDKLVEAGLELVSQMKPGKIPQAQMAPPFHGKPWEYGSVKPELQ